MLSVAIIGAGRIGQIRAAVVRRSDSAALSAVADVDLGRAQRLARDAQALATDDWQSVVARPDVDAVIVSTPTKFHVDAAIAALESGKHVLCEKPLARTVDEARRMFDAARKHRRVLKTGFNYRYMAHVRRAKELFDAGALGPAPLHFFRCRFGHCGRPGYEQEWCTNAELSGGGVLIEQGIHILDLVRHLFGEPARLLADTRRFFWNFASAEDNAFCLIETAGGAMAQMHVSWTQWVNIFELEVFGRDGYLRLTGRDGHYGPPRLVWGKRKPDHTRPEEEIFEFPAADDSWKLEWDEFLAAIRSSKESAGSVPHGLDGLRAQQLVEAAYRSATERRWIEIPVLQFLSQGASQ